MLHTLLLFVCVLVPAALGDTAGCLGAGLLAWDLIGTGTTDPSAETTDPSTETTDPSEVTT